MPSGLSAPARRPSPMEIDMLCAHTSSAGGQGQAAGAATPREALATTPWLAAITSSILDRLAQQSILHRVPAGSVLFEQAETPAFAQLLVTGSVELLGMRDGHETLVELTCA